MTVLPAELVLDMKAPLGLVPAVFGKLCKLFGEPRRSEAGLATCWTIPLKNWGWAVIYAQAMPTALHAPRL